MAGTTEKKVNPFLDTTRAKLTTDLERGKYTIEDTTDFETWRTKVTTDKSYRDIISQVDLTNADIDASLKDVIRREQDRLHTELVVVLDLETGEYRKVQRFIAEALDYLILLEDMEKSDIYGYGGTTIAALTALFDKNLPLVEATEKEEERTFWTILLSTVTLEFWKQVRDFFFEEEEE